MLRSFLRTSVPARFRRVLLVESGSRHLLEELIPGIYKSHEGVVIDLVTCYAGKPVSLRDDARVYRVTDYGGAAGREKMLADLRPNGYDVLGIICSAEPIMTKWKWWLAFQLDEAKSFALNENGDYFWIDRGHASILFHFVMFRLGMSGAGAPATIVRLLLLPFSALGLVLFAAAVHLKRALSSQPRHGRP